MMQRDECARRDQKTKIDEARKGLIDPASLPVSRRVSDMFPGPRLTGVEERLRIMRHPDMALLETRDVPWLKEDDLALWCALHGRRSGHARVEGLLILALQSNPNASFDAVVRACLVNMGCLDASSVLNDIGRPLEVDLLHDAFAEDVPA